jgi:hypothetical protein
LTSKIMCPSPVDMSPRFLASLLFPKNHILWAFSDRPMIWNIWNIWIHGCLTAKRLYASEKVPCRAILSKSGLIGHARISLSRSRARETVEVIGRASAQGSKKSPAGQDRPPSSTHGGSCRVTKVYHCGSDARSTKQHKTRILQCPFQTSENAS